MKLRLSLLALGLAACGPGAPSPQAAVCNVTIAGAKTASPPCRGMALLFRTDTQTANFSVTDDARDPQVVFLTQWTFKTEPTARTYTGGADGVECSVQVKEGARTWRALHNSMFSEGTCALTFSRVTLDAQAGANRSYRFEGTLTATLPALASTGSTGTVQFDATLAGP